MKIIVLNGSPKADLSVTLQYVNFLQKKNPQDQYEIFHITQRIKRIENDETVFTEIIEKVRSADGVLWAFPLYILLVHAQYKRFIELIFERGVQNAFAGKYAATISTSIHYFDHTAHNYMHAICDDLGMRFVSSFSPEMDDLRKISGQQQLLSFNRHFIHTIQSGISIQRQYPPILYHPYTYTPTLPINSLPTAGKKVVIVHDENDPASNLSLMIKRARSAFAGDVTVVNINSIDISGGCLGCLKCGSNNICAYEGKDGFIDFYRSTVMSADILIFAGTIKDRYLSSRWKTFFDRAFFNSHTPVLQGKQLAFLVSGPFSQIPNLQEVFKGWAEFQMANLVGFVSDETESSADLDQWIDQMVNQMLYFSNQKYTAPMTFLGIGGAKIFRDDIWGNLRFVFYADHRAYQRIGLYKTFPQTDWRTIFFNLFVTPLLQIKPIRKGFDKQMKEQMVLPLKQLVEKA